MKTLTAKDLQADLERLEERRVDLQGQLSEAQDALSRSRIALVDGDGSAADVTSAQSTFSALKEALAGLGERIAARQEERKTLLAAEYRAEQIRIMRGAADEGTAQRQAFAEAAEEANRVLGPLVEKMAAAVDGMVDARELFVTTGVALEPGLRRNHIADWTNSDPRAAERAAEYRQGATALMDELQEAGADLATVLTPWAGTKGNLETISDRALPLPTPEPYGPAILEGMAAKRKAKREAQERREAAVRESARLERARERATADIFVPLSLGDEAQACLGELVQDTVRINNMMLGQPDQLALTVRFNDLKRAEALLTELPELEYTVRRDPAL